MIRVESVSKRYGAVQALDGLSFHVEPGGVVGFLGANGAGKSTLMRILLGLVQPDAGRVRVCGADPVADPVTVRGRVGYLPETNPLYPELRVEEFLRYRARLKGVGRRRLAAAVGAVLEDCRLADVRRRLVGELSKGYRQRVGLAESLLGETDLLILDEPMVGLDPNQLREIRRLIHRLGESKTVFLSTHVLHDVEELCREVIILHHGRLLAVDSPGRLCAMSSRARVLVIEAPAYDGLAGALRALPDVLSLEETPNAGEGLGTFRLRMRRGGDVRLQVLRLFTERGWLLREMRVEPVRLEEIFAELTGRDFAVAGEGRR